MKVLYITNYDTMYGANKSLFAMMELLKDKYGIEPFLLVPGYEGGVIGSLCKKKGIPCLCYDFRISVVPEDMKYKNIHKVTRHIMRNFDFIRVARGIEKQNLEFDMVHSNSSIFDIGLFLAKRWKIPHVWHVREFAKEDYGLETVLSKRAIRRNYLNTNKVIAISEAIKSIILKYDKTINAKRIYNGIDYIPEYNKKYCSKGAVCFCIVGSLIKGKNQLDVLKACVELERRSDYAYRVYFLGDTDGTYYEELSSYLDKHKEIQLKVFFEGYCDNVNAFLKQMDVGIIPSEKEGFGRVTVEYMGNYMPVIASNAGANGEILAQDGDLFELHNIGALADLMEKYIASPDLLAGVGSKMKQRSMLFTKENNADEVFEVYREVVSQ